MIGGGLSVIFGLLFWVVFMRLVFLSICFFSGFLVMPSTDYGSRVGRGFRCTPCKIDVKFIFLISRLLVSNFVNLFL
jgi:hypothetical protein